MILAGLNKPSVLFKYLFAGNYSRWLNKFNYDFPVDAISARSEALSVEKKKGLDKKSLPADFVPTSFCLKRNPIERPRSKNPTSILSRSPKAWNHALGDSTQWFDRYWTFHVIINISYFARTLFGAFVVSFLSYARRLILWNVSHFKMSLILTERL